MFIIISFIFAIIMSSNESKKLFSIFFLIINNARDPEQSMCGQDNFLG